MARRWTHNGHEFSRKLHSFDESRGQIDWPRGAADRDFLTELWIDLSAHRAGNESASAADHRDGVALLSRRGHSRLDDSAIQASRNIAASDSAADADWRMRSSADHLFEPACTGIHLRRTAGISLLHLPGMGRIARGGAQNGKTDGHSNARAHSRARWSGHHGWCAEGGAERNRRRSS